VAFVKRLWRQDKFRVFLAVAVLAAALLLLRRRNGFLNNLSDFCFISATAHILIGGMRYIHNVGLFKTFFYTAYKMRWKHSGKADGELRPMTLAEYTQNVIMDESRRKPVAWLMVAGVVWCVASLLAAMAVVYL